MIKIGRTINGFGPPIPPKKDNERNYRKIDCFNIYSGLNLVKKAEFSSLNPDNLRDIPGDPSLKRSSGRIPLDRNPSLNSPGRVLSNIWKFSKVYYRVPRVKLTADYGKLTIDAWNHPFEFHVVNNIITENFWKWRRKGFSLKYPITSPVGKSSEEKYLGFIPIHCNLTEDISVENVEILDLIQARKLIYFKLYSKLIKKEKQFYELKEWLKNGQNLFIIDPNGPYYEDIDYYKEKYKVEDNFINSNNITDATAENLKIFLNDGLHEAGFSYYLAALLLDVDPFSEASSEGQQ